MSIGLTIIEGGRSDAASESSQNWATVRKRAKELSDYLETGYMELARLLFDVHDNPMHGDPQRGPIYIGWGYSSFADYAEQELGLSKKRAERLRLIWYTIEIQLKNLDPSLKERMIALGVSKVRELVKVITLRNAEFWIKLAERGTFRDVETAVKDEKGRQRIEETILNSGVDDAKALADAAAEGKPLPLMSPSDPEEDEKIYKKSFGLTKSQEANVLLAIQKSSELSGSSMHGYNLDLICTDFLATNDILGSDQEDLERKIHYVSKMAQMLKLTFIVVDPETGEVVHGLNALERLAQNSKAGL